MESTLCDWLYAGYGAYGEEILNNPEFEKRTRVHDWRNYVPRMLQEKWGNLSCETKIAIFIMAEQMSDREEWD